MAVYGVDFYGTEFYGAPLFLAFDARPFTATSEGYAAIRLDWTHPKIDWQYDEQEDEWVIGPDGAWSALRIVRSSYGFPMFSEDGQIILEQGIESLTTFVDRDLREGQFYYYSIFVFEVENERWVRAADAIGLATEDHRYGEQLFYSMPQFMRQEDLNRRANDGVDGPLRRYLDVVGTSLDHLRTEYESLRWLRDPEKISGGLIWPLAQMFGVPFEPAIGMRQARVWLRDATYLYRIKGTRPGVEAAASAMTGWGARVTRGKNLIRAEGTPAWYSEQPLTDVASPDDPLIPAIFVGANLGTYDVRSTDLALPGADPLPRWAGIPVEELLDYTVTAELRADPMAGTHDHRWEIEWYDDAGGLLSVSQGDGVTTSASEWVQARLTANAPAESAFAVLNLTPVSSADGFYFRRVQFEQSIVPTSWEPASAIVINFDPTRWNFMPNPSFSNGLFSWSVESGTAGVEDDSVGPAPTSRAASLDGEMETFLLGIATSGIPHVFSLYARGTGNITLGIEAFADPLDADPVATYTRTTAIDGEEIASVSGVVPPGVFFAKVTVETDTELLLGSTLFEAGSVPGDYFDGNFFGADYLWAGSVGVSASKYYPNRAERNVRVRELVPDYLPLDQSFIINYIGGAPASGLLQTGDEGTMGAGTYGIMPFGQ